jgi:DUF917 family protein
MNGTEVAQKVVPGSISNAIAIGKAILEARLLKEDPTHKVIEAAHGIKLGSGIISDVDHKIEGGFLKGKAVISSAHHESIEILYQNEFLIAYQKGSLLACTPDILMLMEQETGTPITSSTLDFGMRVDLIALPSPSLWTTPEGLSLVGPQYFGYNVEYKSILKGVSQ